MDNLFFVFLISDLSNSETCGADRAAAAPEMGTTLKNRRHLCITSGLLEIHPQSYPHGVFSPSFHAQCAVYIVFIAI